MKKQGSIIGATVGVAAHKAAVSALTRALRNTDKGRALTGNYFPGLARQGFIEGITKNPNTIMPKRQATLGALAPSASGVVDYNIARVAGGQARSLMGENTTNYQALRRVAKARKLYNSRPQAERTRLMSEIESPITRNLIEGVFNGKKSPTVQEWSRTKMAPQLHTGSTRKRMLLEAGQGFLTHGPAGAAVQATAALPEALVSSAALRGQTRGLQALKTKVLAAGASDSWQDSSLKAIKALDAPTAEIYTLGRDMGRIKMQPQLRAMFDMSSLPQATPAVLPGFKKDFQNLMQPKYDSFKNKVVNHPYYLKGKDMLSGAKNKFQEWKQV